MIQYKHKNNGGIMVNISRPQKEKKWSTKKKIIVAISVILGGILALFLALFVTVNIATTEPLKVSNELVANIQRLNGTETYNLLSNDAQETTSEAEVESIVNQIGPVLTGKPKVESKEINASTEKRSTSIIVYEIFGNDGYIYNLTVTLIKNNDRWQVLNFQSIKK